MKFVSNFLDDAKQNKVTSILGVIAAAVFALFEAGVIPEDTTKIIGAALLLLFALASKDGGQFDALGWVFTEEDAAAVAEGKKEDARD